MKKLRSGPHKHARAGKIACTVSAAALMLGASHAATVGLNFQVDWSENVYGTNSPGSSPAYTGKPVTATAFGIPPSGWQNLSPMPSGYNFSGVLPGPFTSNEVISVITSTNGLHPLPNGSLNVTWSSIAGNASGFAGYGPPYGAPNPNPGEQEVYYGFLRDDVFIYTHPTSTNGYRVTITGLKSVFTNSPYVIQIAAATDSGKIFTNAVVSTSTNTQDLSYTVSNASFGIMGGLSSISSPLNADSITITGAPASRATSAASTISGIIISDKPVVTMSPQPSLLLSNDTVVMRAIAIGVPPLSYQWRKDGTPISGATNLTYGITNVNKISQGGNFDLVVTNLYGSTTSKVAAIIVDHLTSANGPGYAFDSKPVGTNQDGLDFGADWLASSADSLGTNRTGVMQFTASDPDQITVPAAANFNSGEGTIMFWMRSSGTVTNLGGSVGATVFDRSSGGSGLIVAQKDDGTLLIQPASGTASFSSSGNVSDNNWHHVAVTYNSQGVVLYIDGNLDTVTPGGSISWPAAQEIELGHSHNSSWRSYNGLLDDFRLYNISLDQSLIPSAYAGDLVDTNALMLRLNFDAVPAPGATISWGLGSAVLQSADNANGPYTDELTATSPLYLRTQSATRKFYRYRYTHTPTTIITNPNDM